MAFVDFVNKLHKKTDRDYVARVTEHDKAECAEIACRFDEAYWDGPRHVGYGGYRYDGRWRVIAEDMVKHYGLKPGAKILDVGCGKAFLLYEFTQVLPGCEVFGIDISEYGVANAKEEVRDRLRVGNANSLPYETDQFDFVYSINTLHNLYIQDLWRSLEEIERVGKGPKKHITIEAYRNEREKANLMYWQLTCRAFHTPEEWEWLFDRTGYSGDYGYITFE